MAQQTNNATAAEEENMLFNNITILDEDLKVKENMYVETKGDRISYVGSTPPQESGENSETYDGTGKLLMTGFINAHAHSPMALMRGYGENLSLQDWLFTRIFPFEDKLNSNAVYWGTMLCMAESLRFGIVSTSDMYYFMEDMVRAVADSGAKANLSRSLVTIDGDIDTWPSVKEIKDTVRKYQGAENGRIVLETSLHAEYTSDEPTARYLAEYAASEGLGCHIHVSETESEHEECKERHGGMTPVQYLNSCGLFDTRAIAAHCVHIEGEDFDILRDKGVTVATNPISNMKLASGICPTQKILENGINLAIGTDSVASNNSLNYIEEMKVMALLAKVRGDGDPTAITPQQALYAATGAGATAQGREDCGRLKVGNKADLIVMDISQPHMNPVHDLVANVVYSASGSDVVLTMVDGRVLYKDGEYATIDKEKVIYEVKQATDSILAEL